MKIAILDDYHDVAKRYADWGSLGGDAEVRIFNNFIPDDQVLATLEPFDVIVAMRERTPFPADRIRALPNLRLLVTTGMRNNAIDMQACAAQGIVVSGAPGSADANTATAELAWAHILGLFKHLPAEDAAMRRGMWQTAMPEPLAGKRLGVLGLGKLGSAVAKVGQAFGMDVVAWSPNLTDERAAEAGVTRLDKHELFATSDVISLHLILSDRSRHIVDAAALAAMKPTAYLVKHLARRPGGPGGADGRAGEVPHRRRRPGRLSGRAAVAHRQRARPGQRDPDAAPGLRQPRELRGLLPQRAGGREGLARRPAGAGAERLTRHS